MEEFNRIEFKYLLNVDTYDKFLKELKFYVELDEYNYDEIPYKINNIYYDSDTGYLARSAMIEPDYKFKVRYRTYGEFSDSGYLEIKEKNNGIVHKTRIERSSKQVEVLTQEQKNILTYIQNIVQLYELKPQSIITYDRLAYFEKENPDLRITFDYNIFGQKFNKEKRFLLTNDIVMEIKTSTGLPQWLLVLLAKHRIHTQNFSKYVKFYKKNKKEKTNEFD